VVQTANRVIGVAGIVVRVRIAAGADLDAGKAPVDDAARAVFVQVRDDLAVEHSRPERLGRKGQRTRVVCKRPRSGGVGNLVLATQAIVADRHVRRCIAVVDARQFAGHGTVPLRACSRFCCPRPRRLAAAASLKHTFDSQRRLHGFERLQRAFAFPVGSDILHSL
jgi:hypothetical protein